MTQDTHDPHDPTPPPDLRFSQGETQAAGEATDAYDSIAALQTKNDELEQRILRVSADYQNYARRAQQNVENAQRQKLLDIARGLVATLDHFDRALGVDPESTTVSDLFGGVSSIRDELLKALQSFGIQRLDVEAGEEFDPNRHEALMRQPSQDIDSNHIVMQLQPGYLVGDRVVRAAQVAVAE